MASVECLSSQQQAGYMCASLSRHSIEESSCIRGGSIYAPGKPCATEMLRAANGAAKIAEVLRIIRTLGSQELTPAPGKCARRNDLGRDAHSANPSLRAFANKPTPPQLMPAGNQNLPRCFAAHLMVPCHCPFLLNPSWDLGSSGRLGNLLDFVGNPDDE